MGRKLKKLLAWLDRLGGGVFAPRQGRRRTMKTLYPGPGYKVLWNG